MSLTLSHFRRTALLSYSCCAPTDPHALLIRISAAATLWSCCVIRNENVIAPELPGK